MGLIQFHRGLDAGIPVLADGEPGFTTDTFRLWVGYAGVNHEITGFIHDGDYLDISVGAGGVEWTIKPGAVTYSKIQDVTASRLLGRGAGGGDGVMQEITVGSGLSLTGTTLSATGGGVGGVLTDGDYGDIIVSGTSTVFTIDAGVVTYAKMQAVSAASKLLGRGAGAGAGVVQEITLGAGLTMSGATLAAAGGSSAWDVEITKSAPQTVTNSITFVNDSELFFAATAGDVWYVELLLLYSGNNLSGDYRGELYFPVGSAEGWFQIVAGSSFSDSLLNQTTRLFAASDTGIIALGTDNADTPRVARLHAMFRVASSGNVGWKFANYVSAGGRTSTTLAKSILRAKKLSP